MIINIDLEKKMYEDLQKKLALESQGTRDTTAGDSPMFERAWYFGQEERDYNFTIGASAIALS